MRLDRRAFLKSLGSIGLAVAAAPLLVPTSAPLFIPSDRLEMGVPRRLAAAIASGRGPDALSPRAVPMRLNQDEFLLEWGGRLPAGSVVAVDEVTARRWIANRVAAPTESWMRSASAAEQRSVVAQAVPDPWRFRAEPSGDRGYDWTPPLPSTGRPALFVSKPWKDEEGAWFRRAAMEHTDASE